VQVSGSLPRVIDENPVVLHHRTVRDGFFKVLPVWIARLASLILRMDNLGAKPYLRRAVHPLVWFSLATARWAFPDMKLPPASEVLARAQARPKERRG
jgi:hypothetical protein